MLKQMKRLWREVNATKRPFRVARSNRIEIASWRLRDPHTSEEYVLLTHERVIRTKKGNVWSRRPGYYPADLMDVATAAQLKAKELADCPIVPVQVRKELAAFAEMLDLLPSLRDQFATCTQRIAVLREMCELRALFLSGEELLKVLRLIKARKKEGSTPMREAQ